MNQTKNAGVFQSNRLVVIRVNSAPFEAQFASQESELDVPLSL